MAASTTLMSWLPACPAPRGRDSLTRSRSSDTFGPMSERNLVNYSAQQGVAVLELDHPPANAYSYEMHRQLDDAILAARMDESVHVLVVRGAGEKFFCAGADLAMLDGVSA